MGRPKKVQSVEVENVPQNEVVSGGETKVYVFHPSEKEVMCNGVLCLEWTDDAGCTFKQAK